jgi:DNA repair protein RadD
MLRDYQERALNQLYAWFEANETGDPCLVLPTGAGKSHLIAAICKQAIQEWPETRVLMLTHVKELIEQNAERMRQHWPDAPLGIFSAGIGIRQLGEPITFAGIQSVRKRVDEIGHIDLLLIDECHLANHAEQGGYRFLIAGLRQINPAMRVIGFTATPYRLKHGLITDGTALFKALIEPVTIEELVHKKHLAPLRSKMTQVQLDVSGVQKRGGDYAEGELQAAVNVAKYNTGVVKELIEKAGDRRSWLVFCSGVQHAENIKQELQEMGIPAKCVTGNTPKKEREKIIDDFKSGALRALTNANVLTTGFDYPDLDLIAMLRPTLSPGLYMQMAGRGLRPKSHTDHCLVLDFAGVVERHGPITAVRPPVKTKDGRKAPTKTCPTCEEIIAASCRECPACGHVFETEKKDKEFRLRDDDIMGIEGDHLKVGTWVWRKKTSFTSRVDMLTCTYYGESLSDTPITEYFTVLHQGYAGQKAIASLSDVAMRSGAGLYSIINGQDLHGAAISLTSGRPPRIIRHKRDGKFVRVIERIW